MTGKTILAMALGCAMTLAQSALSPPRVGYVVASDGSLRPVLGTAGNFLLGEPVAPEAISAASSGRYTLAKKAQELVLLDAGGQVVKSWPAPGGPATMAFTAKGAPGAVYYTETRELFRIEGHDLVPVPVDAEVAAVATPGRGVVALVVRRGEDFWQLTVSTATGAVSDERRLPGVAAPLLLRPDGTLIYAADGELVVRRPEATEWRTALEFAPCGMGDLGPGWVLVRGQREGGAAERRYALRLSEEGGQVYELPEAPR